MNTALPVTIIGGYLGSGKTTLVNHLLRQANGIRLAVLVNDFGELPIDADLIEAQDGDVISLSGGCICCSYGDDLSLSLQKLQAQEITPEHILIEASGVALPGAIGKSLTLHRAYQLEGIVVLADATTVQSSVAEKYIGDTIDRQLTDADLIVLNKIDCLSEHQAITTKHWLGENYSQTPILETAFSKIDPIVFFNIEHNNAALPRKESHAPHNIVFSTANIKIETQVDANALAAHLAGEQCGLVRAKGFVRDQNNSLKTIQVVGRRWSVTDAPENVKTGLVCIANTRDLSEEHIRRVCNLNDDKA